MKAKERHFFSGLTPGIWAHRFWARIKDQTGLSAGDMSNDFSLSDIEQWVQGFEEDPESAADAQIAKWRKNHPLFDQSFQEKIAEKPRVKPLRH